MAEEKSGKRKTLGMITGVVFFAIAYYGTKQFFKKDFESVLKNAALELNKQTPMQIDQYSRLDSASTIGKTNFVYHYTLNDIVKSEVNIDTVDKYIRPNIIENVKSNPDLKVFRDNNVTLDYKYYDKNGEFALDVSVTPELYRN